MSSIGMSVDVKLNELVDLQNKIIELRTSLKKLDMDAEPKAFRDQEKVLKDLSKQYDSLKGDLGSIVPTMQRLYKEMGTTMPIEKSIEVLKKFASEQANALSDMEANLNKTRAAWEGLEAGGKKNELAKQLKYEKALIEDQRAEVEKSIKSYKDLEAATKSTGSAKTTLRTQILHVKNEMSQLTLAGQTQSTRYKELQAELTRLGTAYNEVGKQQKLLTTAGNAQIAGIVQGVTAISGAFTAVSGVASLFINDQEKLVAVQKNLQAAMSITIGLQTVSQALHSTSSFRIGIVNKVTQAWTAAQNALNVSLGLGTVLSKALMFTGIGLLIAGIIALVGAYSKWRKASDENIKKQKEEAKAIKEAAEEVKKAAKARMESAASTVGKELLMYKQLQKTYNDLNGNLYKQKKFVEDNKKAFNDLGFSVNSVDDAEKLLIAGESAFIQSLKNKAFAAASMEYASEIYKKAIEKMMSADENRAKAKAPTKADLTEEQYEQVSRAARGRMKGYARTLDFLDAKEFEERLAETITQGSAGSKQAETALKLYSTSFNQVLEKYSGEIKKSFEDAADADEESAKDFFDKSEEALKTAYEGFKKNVGVISSIGVDLYEEDAKKSKVTDDRKKNEEQAAKILEDIRKKNAETAVKLIEDEGEREIAQIRLNYDNRIAEIKKREEELTKLRGGVLTQEELEDISIAYTGAGEELEKDLKAQQNKTQKSIDELLKKYQDYAAQRTALEKTYNEDVKKLGIEREKALTSGDTARVSAIDNAINEATKNLKKSLSEIDMEELKESINWEQIFGNLEKVGTATLEGLRGKIRKFINESKNLSPKDLKELTDALENMDKTIRLRNPFKSLSAGIKEYADKTKVLKSAQKELNDLIKSGTATTKQLEKSYGQVTEATNDQKEAGKNLSDSISKVVGDFNTLTDALSTIGGDGATKEFLLGAAEGLSSFGNAAAAFASGDIVGGISGVITGVTKLYSVFTNGSKVHKENLRLLEEQNMALEKSYNLAKISTAVLGELSSSIFGTDQYGKAKSALTGYQDAVKLTADAVKALGNAEVITGYKKKKFLGVTTGSKAVYDKMLKQYPDLINSEGELNLERAKAILSTANLDSASKRLLEDAIEYTEAMKEAYDTMNSYFESVFGNLGSTLTSALADAFRNGTDAAKTFTDSVSDMLDKLAEDMFYSMYMAPLLAAAQDKIMGIFESNVSDATKFNQYADVLKDLTNQASALGDVAEAWFGMVENVKDVAGLSKSATSEATAITKGIASLTEDTGKALEGRFTALQMAGEEIKQENKEQTSFVQSIDEQLRSVIDINTGIFTIVDETRTFIVRSYMELQMIQENTAGNWKTLKEVAAKISSIERKIDKAF